VLTSSPYPRRLVLLSIWKGNRQAFRHQAKSRKNRTLYTVQLRLPGFKSIREWADIFQELIQRLHKDFAADKQAVIVAPLKVY